LFTKGFVRAFTALSKHPAELLILLGILCKHQMALLIKKHGDAGVMTEKNNSSSKFFEIVNKATKRA
jgi:hypothetical protein